MTGFRNIWIEQCEAAEGIRERFGLQKALGYLIRDGVFEVSDAAIKKDAEWIPNISATWTRRGTAMELCQEA